MFFLPRSSSGSGGDSNTRGIRITSSPTGFRTEPTVVARAGSTSLYTPLPTPHNIKVGRSRLYTSIQQQGRSEQAATPSTQPSPLHTTSRQVRAGSNPLHPTLLSPQDIKVGQSRLQPPPLLSPQDIKVGQSRLQPPPPNPTLSTQRVVAKNE